MSEEAKKNVGDDIKQETEEVPMEASFHEEKGEKDFLETESQPEFETPRLVEVEREPQEIKLVDNALEEEPPNEESAMTDLSKDSACSPEEDFSKEESPSTPCDGAPDIVSQPLGGDEEVVRSSETRDPVVDLLFWRDVKWSAFSFAMSLLILISLRFFSVVMVTAYLALSLLTVTISIRLYKFVLQTLNGSQQPNPFQSFLDTDISLTRDQVDRYVDSLLGHLNNTVASTRDLLLVKSVIASLKFGTLMWLLTYIGCCMNGLTILNIVVLLAFTLPPIYEKYQEPIDGYWGVACSKVNQVVLAVKAKIPGAKAKTQ